MKYNIPITLDLGAALPTVGKVVDGINKNLSDFGFDEKLCIRSEIGTVTITVGKNLDYSEKLKIREVLQECFEEKLPDYKVKVSPPNGWESSYS